MPQGLSSAPATFNRGVSYLLRPVRLFAPSYFDNIYIHSRVSFDKSEVEVHREHLRQVFDIMHQNKLYVNKKEMHIWCKRNSSVGLLCEYPRRSV